MLIKSIVIIASLLSTLTVNAKNNMSLAEVKKILTKQQYMQYTHDLWEKGRKKAQVTDYSGLFNNKQGGNTLTVGPNVLCGFPTIQLAINFAIPGDSIFVADDLIIGTDAKLNIDKELTLVGGLDSTCQVFTANRTHLQLGDTGPVITIDVSGGKNVSIAGFDISQSQPSGVVLNTSGIYVTGDGTVTISNSHIHHNESLLGGGVSAVNGSTVNINENTEIYANTANALGAGIYCSQSKLNVIDTLIGRFDNGIGQGNIAKNEGSNGGGIYSGNCTVQLGETTMGNGAVEINYNKAQLGAGIYTIDSNFDFGFNGSRLSFNETSFGNTGNGNALLASNVNNIIFSDISVTDNLEGVAIQISNSSDFVMRSKCSQSPCSELSRNKGFALSLQNAATATLVQTAISENETIVFAINGTGNSGLNIINSLITNNFTQANISLFKGNTNIVVNFKNVTIANNPGFISIFNDFGNIGGTTTFDGGIIWGNTAANLLDAEFSGTLEVTNSIIQYNTAGMVNTIQADPLFNNAANGDYHITFNSPAKDYFDSSLINDFEGDSRPQGLLDDAGADEWTDLIFKHGFEQN